MKTFDKPIIVKKSDNGNYTVSILVNEKTVITQILKEFDIRQLLTDIESILDK